MGTVFSLSSNDASVQYDPLLSPNRQQTSLGSTHSVNSTGNARSSYLTPAAFAALSRVASRRLVDANATVALALERLVRKPMVLEAFHQQFDQVPLEAFQLIGTKFFAFFDQIY